MRRSWRVKSALGVLAALKLLCGSAAVEKAPATEQPRATKPTSDRDIVRVDVALRQ